MSFCLFSLSYSTFTYTKLSSFLLQIQMIAVIDILQYYNACKVGETVMRKAVGNSGEDISCVDPETYGKRFIKFISNLVEE